MHEYVTSHRHLDYPRRSTHVITIDSVWWVAVYFPLAAHTRLVINIADLLSDLPFPRREPHRRTYEYGIHIMNKFGLSPQTPKTSNEHSELLNWGVWHRFSICYLVAFTYMFIHCDKVTGVIRDDNMLNNVILCWKMVVICTQKNHSKCLTHTNQTTRLGTYHVSGNVRLINRLVHNFSLWEPHKWNQSTKQVISIVSK